VLQQRACRFEPFRSGERLVWWILVTLIIGAAAPLDGHAHEEKKRVAEASSH
jgi:hypothetical protein